MSASTPALSARSSSGARPEPICSIPATGGVAGTMPGPGSIRASALGSASTTCPWPTWSAPPWGPGSPSPASRSRGTTTTRSSSPSSCVARDRSGSGQGGVAEQQALAAQAGEVDLGHGALALAGDVRDHALAPLAVDDLVAGGQVQVEGPALAAGQALGRGRLAVEGHRRRPRAGVEAAAAGPERRAGVAPAGRAGPGGRLGLDGGDHDQLLGDPLEEARGQVVVGRPEKGPAPGVSQV